MIFNGETYKNYSITSSAYCLMKSPKNFEKISCHIFKMAIFSKFFGDLMSHIIKEYADEEMKYFLYILPLKIMDILLSVFLVSSLYEKSVNLNQETCMYSPYYFYFWVIVLVTKGVKVAPELFIQEIKMVKKDFKC